MDDPTEHVHDLLRHVQIAIDTYEPAIEPARRSLVDEHISFAVARIKSRIE